MTDIFSSGTPEEVGLRSEWVESFFRKLVEKKFLSHSLLVVRNSKIVGEGYFAPFRRDDRHRMYSTSKSFVSTAIGMLIGEGRLSLDDKVVKFFPDRVQEPVHPWLAATTIRDLLVMATPYANVTYSFHRKDWVDSFFRTAPAHPSGTYFNYDTAGSFILDVIVERLTGKPFMDYLYDVLLGETGFTKGVLCINSPDGYSWGGSGVLCTTRDLARLGQIYLNHGEVHGRQLLPRDYAEAAVSRQIDNNTAGHLDLMHGHGYGYQIWLAAHGCFGFYGMGGQLMFACPKYNLLMAATSDEQGSANGYLTLAELFYSELVDRLDAEPHDTLPENPDGVKSLREYTSHLTCAIPFFGEPESKSGQAYFDRVYTFDGNKLGIERLSVVKLSDGRGALRFFARGEEKEIPFGFGRYEIAPFPETGYSGSAIGEPMGRGYRTMSTALWTEPKKLVIRSFLIDDYFGNLTTTLAFKDNTVTVFMQKAAEFFLEQYTGFAVGTESE